MIRYNPHFGSADGSFKWSLLNYIASQRLANGDVSVTTEDPAKIMERAMLCQELNKALDEVGEKEADIVRMRYGLNGGTPMTLNDIAKKIKLSRERVRCIEERALLRLRRVAARMGLVELGHYPTTHIQPGWDAPKLKTDILGDAMPSKPYLPKKK